MKVAGGMTKLSRPIVMPGELLQLFRTPCLDAMMQSEVFDAKKKVQSRVQA
jgi:hypothetical protein